LLLKSILVKSDKKDIFIVFLLFFISFAAYIKTLCPTIYPGDSGELVAAVHVLGIPHPTGYPLYCLLGKLFTILIPFGSIAYKVNIMSAFFSSLTVSIVYLIVKRFVSFKSVAFASALLLAFSAAFWSQAVIAEVYALNSFFVALLILIALIYEQNRNVNYFYFLIFAYGLALTNHLTIILLAPAILCLIKPAKKEEWHFSLLKAFFPLFLFVLGLSLYLYLPIRSMANPQIDWGNPENLNNFIYHITAGQYQNRLFSLSFASVAGNFLYFFAQISQQWPIWLIWLPLIGVVSLFKKRDKFLFFSLIATSILLLFSINYNISDIEVYYIPSYILITVFIGVGISSVLELFKNKTSSTKAFYVLCGVFFLLPLVVFAANYRLNNNSGNEIAYKYATDILKTLDKNAILFAQGDNVVFPLSYLQIVEKQRLDVLIIDENINPINFSLFEKERNQKRIEFIKKTVAGKNRPVYFSSNENLYDYNIYDYFLKSKGLLCKVVSIEAGAPFGNYHKFYKLDGLPKDYSHLDKKTREILASYYFHEGENLRKGDFLPAFKVYFKSGEIGDDISSMHNNIGLAYAKRGWQELALKEFEKAIKLDDGFVSAHYNLGNIYFMQDRLTNAQKELERAIGRDKDFALAYNSLGMVYLNQGLWDNAEEMFAQSIKVNPLLIVGYNNLGHINWLKKNYIQAKLYYQKALEIDCENKNAEYGIAEADRMLKK